MSGYFTMFSLCDFNPAYMSPEQLRRLETEKPTGPRAAAGLKGPDHWYYQYYRRTDNGARVGCGKRKLEWSICATSPNLPPTTPSAFSCFFLRNSGGYWAKKKSSPQPLPILEYYTRRPPVAMGEAQFCTALPLCR